MKKASVLCLIIFTFMIPLACGSNVSTDDIQGTATNELSIENANSLTLDLDNEVEYYFSAGSNGVLSKNEKIGFNDLFREVDLTQTINMEGIEIPKGGVSFRITYYRENNRIDISFGANRLSEHEGYYIKYSEKDNHKTNDIETAVTFYALNDELGKEISEYYDSIYR